MTDTDIRSALHRKPLRRFKTQPNTLVIDELGLAHARSRIDVAVINGCIQGYEIKSDRDELHRLERQMNVYRKTLQKLTIVAASRHIECLWDSVPKWCGIIEAAYGRKGGVELNILRSARLNPEIDPVLMAHLLWRSEVLQLLSRLGYTPKDLRCPRKRLYQMLSEVLKPREITEAIRDFMLKRTDWRDHQQRA